MSSWQQTTLGDVLRNGGSIKTGPFGTMLKANEYAQSGVPVISVGEVQYGAFQLRRDTPRVSAETTDRLSEYLLETGDVVFGRKGAVDRSAQVKAAEHGWFLGSDGIRVRFPESVSSTFIAYQIQLSSIKRWLLQHASGSTMLSLNQKVLARLPLSLPPIGEQRAIAEVLGALDDKIAANNKLAMTLSEMASAQYALVSENCDNFVPLRELVTTQYGVTTSAQDGPGPYLIRVTDINKKPWIEWETTPSCILDESKWEKYKVSAGDILVARMADPGKAAYVDVDHPDAVFASYLVRLHAMSPSQALYIYYFLCSPAYHSYSRGAMQGSVQKNMNAKVIIDTSIPFPDEDAINEFNDFVFPIRAQIQQLLKESKSLRELRDTLLPQSMSGKIRVRDAEAVVEDVL